MELTLIAIATRPQPKSSLVGNLAADYLTRASRYASTKTLTLPSEPALVAILERKQARAPTHLILLDSRGQLLTSEEFAQHLGRQRDNGTQRVMLAIGPADGWSAEARARADLLFSLGRITLPHELARAVLAEQIYRALTILAGHPYHSGH